MTKLTARHLLLGSALLSALLLGACGQMGPLYMPTEEPPAAPDSAAPASVAPTEATTDLVPAAPGTALSTDE